MRVKTDKTSWKAGGVIARDIRAAKDELVQKASTKRKDTKRWCRGKVGKDHVASEWLPVYLLDKEPWAYVKRCLVCNKKLNIKYRCLFNTNEWEKGNERW